MFGGGSNPSGGIFMSVKKLLNITDCWINYIDDITRLEFENYGPIAWDRQELIDGLLKSIMVLAVTVDERVVGNLFVDLDAPPNDGVYIWSVVTDKAFRGQGIATSMMHAVVDRYSTKQIRLMVKTQNDTAIRLYERFGFAYEQKQLNAYVDGSDGWYMIRPPDDTYDSTIQSVGIHRDSTQQA